MNTINCWNHQPYSRRWMDVICCQYNKLGHSKEGCHYNPNNPNNKLKDKNEVVVNGVLTQLGTRARNKFNNKGGHGDANKSSSIIYCYFIYNFVKHQIYDSLHNDIFHTMFKEKVTTSEPKKEDVTINMVLAITTCNQIPKNVVFKEKEPHKNKCLADWQENEKFQSLFEKTIKDIQQKELLGGIAQTLNKANLTKIFGLDTENHFSSKSTSFIGFIDSIKSTRLPGYTSSTKSIGATNFTKSTRSIRFIGFIRDTVLPDLSKISEQLNIYLFWIISPNNYWKVNIPLHWVKSSR